MYSSLGEDTSFLDTLRTSADSLNVTLDKGGEAERSLRKLVKREGNNTPSAPGAPTSSNTMLYAGGAVVALLGGYLIYRKMKG